MSQIRVRLASFLGFIPQISISSCISYKVMRIVSVIAGFANLMKAAPIHRALTNIGFDHSLVDLNVLNSHYADGVLTELHLPKPAMTVRYNSTDYLEFTQKLIEELARIFRQMKPSMVIVYGDMNGIISACIAATQESIPVAHVEAGLRNFDPFDTEEFNRVVADRFSCLNFTISIIGSHHLEREGVQAGSIKLVGNTIIDNLINFLPLANSAWNHQKNYGLVTMHKEQNLIKPHRLATILEGLGEVQTRVPLVFIIYPSTDKALRAYDLYNELEKMPQVRLLPRQGILDYVKVLTNASFVVTDSSGLQDEASFLGIPCFTLLDVTHREDTIIHGNNVLVGASTENISSSINNLLSQEQSQHLVENRLRELWDGKASLRIAAEISRYLGYKATVRT